MERVVEKVVERVVEQDRGASSWRELVEKVVESSWSEIDEGLHLPRNCRVFAEHLPRICTCT